MNTFLDGYDWRKRATKQASMTATHDLDIEKAFSDQASGFVENKVGDLMKDQYRVGFEIIKKNEDNTRMVGIFAFKVEKDLILAVVFFLSGEIKGPILYRCDTKTFVPGMKEWATYLIESLEKTEGKGRSRSRRSESVPLVQMQRIAFRPGNMRKGASCCAPEECKQSEITINVLAKRKSLSAVTEFGNVVNNYDSGTSRTRDSVYLPTDDPEASVPSTMKVAAWDDGTIRCHVAGEWVMLTEEDKFLIEKAARTNGEVLDLADEFGIQIDAQGSQAIKKAFFENIPQYASVWAEEMLDMVATKSASAGLIREFLEEPDFGEPATDLLLKAASDRKGYKFATMLAGIYGSPENLIPAAFKTTEKRASVGPKPTLTLQYSVDVLEKSAAATRNFCADGFHLSEGRPPEYHSLVVDDITHNMQHPTDAGYYSLMCRDGSFQDKVLIIPAATTGVYRHSSPRFYASGYEAHESLYYVVRDGKVNYSRAQDLVGILQTPVIDIRKTGSEFPDIVTTPSEGKIYMVVDRPSQVVIEIIYVGKTKTVDGVIYMDCDTRKPLGAYDLDEWFSTERATKGRTYNPHMARAAYNNHVYGASTIFVELAPATERGVGSRVSPDGATYRRLSKLPMQEYQDNVDKWIFRSAGASKLKVKALEVEKKACWTFTDGKKSTRALNKVQSLIKLARDMGIAAPVAYDILDRAKSQGELNILVHPMHKSASQYQLVDRPNFEDEEFDSEFGVPVRPDKEYHLRVQAEQEFEPPSAIGDAMNPTSSTGLPNLTVATTAPEDLRSLADVYNLPNVFEHGVVGALADTFNALTLIDKYIPKLEDGVDALGRIKFLLHWCPSDFEKAYGNDDMVNLEAEIDSNFESQGLVLLKLLKKSDSQKKNNRALVEDTF